ncbi:helix-turn-helix domain-containing protein [Halorubrum gandharaense]
MFEDRPGTDPAPDPEVVFAALDDPACRDIVVALDEPMTAKEVSDRADVPLSTAYKKLDRLESASMLEEHTQIDAGGHHRSQYVVAFDRLLVGLEEEEEEEATADERRSFDVVVERSIPEPDDRLVEMWSAVRRET